MASSKRGTIAAPGCVDTVAVRLTGSCAAAVGLVLFSRSCRAGPPIGSRRSRGQTRARTAERRRRLVTVARALQNPGLAFLPDGRMLVTERPAARCESRGDGSLSRQWPASRRRCTGTGRPVDIALDPVRVEWVDHWSSPSHAARTRTTPRGRARAARRRRDAHVDRMQSSPQAPAMKSTAFRQPPECSPATARCSSPKVNGRSPKGGCRRAADGLLGRSSHQS